MDALATCPFGQVHDYSILLASITAVYYWLIAEQLPTPRPLRTLEAVPCT